LGTLLGLETRRYRHVHGSWCRRTEAGDQICASRIRISRELLAAFHEWRKRDRLRTELYGLNDRELMDIGITRFCIDALALHRGICPARHPIRRMIVRYLAAVNGRNGHDQTHLCPQADFPYGSQADVGRRSDYVPYSGHRPSPARRSLSADCVEEDGELIVWDGSKRHADGRVWCSSGLQSRRQDQLCQLSEV